MNEAILGRIFDIKRFAVHDGPGIRTTVFLKGCPLQCIWCHNPEGIKYNGEVAVIEQKCIGCGSCIKTCPNGVYAVSQTNERIINRDKCTLCKQCVKACFAEALIFYGEQVDIGYVMDIILQDKDFYKSSDGGVTISGGEPLSQIEFSAGIFKNCKEHGIHTALDTSGYAPWSSFEQIIPYTDLILYDIKHIIEDQHIKYTGVSNRLIISNLKNLEVYSIPIEIRIPVIPGINDASEHIKLTAQFIDSIKNVKSVKLLPYHSLAGSKYAAICRENNMPENSEKSQESVSLYSKLFAEYSGKKIVF